MRRWIEVSTVRDGIAAPTHKRGTPERSEPPRDDGEEFTPPASYEANAPRALLDVQAIIDDAWNTAP